MPMYGAHWYGEALYGGSIAPPSPLSVFATVFRAIKMAIDIS